MNTPKIFYDTEFLEGEQTIYQYGLKTDTWLRIFAAILYSMGLLICLITHSSPYIGLLFYIPGFLLYNLSMTHTPPTIDLISIGMVDDYSREYYAISKDFNLKEAWNRFDEKVEIMYGDMRNRYPEGRKTKVYWIRENVLSPIYNELATFHINDSLSVSPHPHFGKIIIDPRMLSFTYKNLKWLIETYGKSNKQIAQEVKDFCMPVQKLALDSGIDAIIRNIDQQFELYAYYGDYDHVCLSWLYGKMINLPDEFPQYSRDLKQMLDEKAKTYHDRLTGVDDILEVKLLGIKSRNAYPKEPNTHHALSDAIFCKNLHTFLVSI